jgi:hypothetical protein
MTLDNKLRSRVEKMLALADDAANENEAAVAMSKAQQILLAHNLTLATFAETAPDAPQTETIAQPYVVDFEQGATWRLRLLHTVAIGNLCYLIGGGKRAYVFGTAGNVEDVLIMFDWLSEQAQRLAHETAETRKAQHLESYGEKLRDTRGFKNSFHAGFQATIRKRLDDSRGDFDHREQSTALVVVEQDAEAAGRAHFGGKLRKGRSRHVANREGYRAGMAAGSGASMSQPRALSAGPRQLRG